MTTTTVTYTPWGWTKDVVELAEGVWRVSTPSHGGLKLSRERWDELPAELTEAMYTPAFAEEDCEEPIVRTLLGIGDDRERDMALKIAGYFERYAPALPYLRDCAPAIHYHVLACGDGSVTEAFKRFDTQVEAESFADDAAVARHFSKLKAVSCNGTRPVCRAEGGRV